MRKSQLIVVFLIALTMLFSGCAKIGVVKSIDRVEGISEKKALTSMDSEARFYTRKRFIFLIAWNGIPVGRVIAESGDMITYKGRKAYVLKVVTESNKFLSKIYRVEDIYISYVDAETMSSLRYEADRKEGSYKKQVIVEYDFDKMEAIYHSLLDGSIKRCPIEKNVQDPLSAMAYFMTLPVKPGNRVKITVNLNEKNYHLFCEIGKVEAVKLPTLGTWAGFNIRPYAELKGRRVKKGRAYGYISTDKKRYPLFGVVLTRFGRVTATLKNIEDF